MSAHSFNITNIAPLNYISIAVPQVTECSWIVMASLQAAKNINKDITAQI